MKYRPEIDGLRAVAVLPVILFHAGFPAFAGGFVGVDVFFVISGFLITSVLLGDLEAGRFSLLSFYERRARRILPALFLVMAACLPFVWFWLLPVQIEEFMESVIATVLFLSNFLFWDQSGYFDTDAELKPLLHTWSLAVEEQFYILFPLLLAGLFRRARRYLFTGLGAVLILSFAISIWSVDRHPAAAFFLLPARAWELLAGSVAALVLARHGAPGHSGLNQIGALAGLALIAGAIAVMDEQTPFPGIAALAPVIGTVLILVCAQSGTLAHWLLAARGPVMIGLISYSAYLWHQPIFALVRLRFGEVQEPWVMGALALMVLPLAWLSWRFVEQPFRDRSAISVRGLSLVLTSVGGVLLAVGIAGDRSDGFEEQIIALRLTSDQQALYATMVREADDAIDRRFDDGDCRFAVAQAQEIPEGRLARCMARHGPGLLVIGDSHAIDLYNMVAQTELHPFVIGVAAGGCRPHGEGHDCFEMNIAPVPTAAGAIFSHIIFHQSGSHLMRDRDGRADSQAIFDKHGAVADADAVETVIEYLTRTATATPAKVIWVGPFIEYRHQPLDALLNPVRMDIHPRSEAIFAMLEQEIAKRLSANRPFRYVPFADVYRVPRTALAEGCFHFSDGDHFSSCGETRAAQSETLRSFVRGLD